MSFFPWKRSIGTCYILSILFSAVVTAISVPAAMPLLRLMRTGDDIIGRAHSYIVTIFAGVSATFIYNMSAAMLRAIGDSRTPLVFLIFASVLNIGLDFLCILVFHMDVMGAGFATVLSQLIAGALCLVYGLKKYELLRIRREHWKWDGAFAWKHIKVGLPMALQFSITAIGVMVVQAVLNDLGTLTVAAPLTLTGSGSCTWQTLDQRAALTLDGPNLSYRPPWLGAGQSAFPLALTVRGGAELFLCEGQVTGFGLDASAARAITIGPGGILTVTRRDLFARRLILDGGRLDLGNPSEKMAPLDLKAGATLEVRGEAAIGSLSGVDGAFVNIGGNTIAFAGNARLSCAVPLRGTGTLTLAGPGTLALADGTEVRAPTLVGQGVRLEGGIFADKTLSLTGGARLTPDRPITVAGTFSAAGTITVEGARSGILIRGGAKTAVSFATPEGFEARRVGDDWRLVAKYATAPLPYVGGAEADALPATPERNLLVLTTTDRKESGLWEDYARFRSSAEGGGWNVLIAALGNLADGQTAADYIAASGCDYVLLGLSAAELPPLDGSADRLPGHHVGRLPLRETLALGTVVDLSSEGDSATQEYTTYSDADLLAAYVAKLRRAGPRHAPGALTLQGTAYDDNRTYTNAIDYGALWPALAGWTLGNKRATSLYALFDRYAALKTLAPNAFDNLFLACDGAYRTDGTPSGRADLATQNATLLWAEGADGRDTLGLLQARGGKNRLTAEAIPGLATLILAPIGQSGDLAARTPDTPCVGELLVLNPAGGALAAILPTHASDTAITDAGLPSGPTHTACANLAAELLRTPAPTIGEALTRATGTAGLTLLGDPTTRPTPRPPLGYRLLLR